LPPAARISMAASAARWWGATAKPPRVATVETGGGEDGALVAGIAGAP
jgi:hypothetical protein